MGHQPIHTRICHYKKSSLPCLWSFLFGIALRCITRWSSRLDKAKLEIYSLLARLYYGLNVDYATYPWEEFGTSITHTNISNCVSSACFWSLILHDVYWQEDILVPFDVETAEFPIMAAPRILLMIQLCFQLLLVFMMQCSSWWIVKVRFLYNILLRLTLLHQHGFFHKRGWRLF